MEPLNNKPGSYGWALELNGDDLNTVESRLYPEQWSRVGFLYNGQKLKDLCAADAETLKKHKVTHKQMGDLLESLAVKSSLLCYKHMQKQRSDKFLGFSPPPKAVIDGKYQVTAGMMTKGYQECPFSRNPQSPCGTSSGGRTIENLITKKNFYVDDLLSHLIKEHGFFEGTEYRLDPELACEVLDMEPGKDYAPQYRKFSLWSRFFSSSIIDSNVYSKARNDAIRTIDNFSQVQFACILPYRGSFWGEDNQKNEEEYLHIFSSKALKLDLDNQIEIEGKQLELIGGKIWKGHSVFSTVEKTEVILGLDDKVST